MNQYIRKFRNKFIAVLILIALFTIDFVQLSKVFADNKPSYMSDEYLFSSSEKVLSIIQEQIYNDYSDFFNQFGLNQSLYRLPEYACNESNRIDIVKRYPTGFGGFDNQHYEGYVTILPSDYIKYSNKKENIINFDFSNHNLGNVSELPNFSLWENVHVLFFADCNITDWSGFENAYATGKFNYVDKIYLNGNKITKSEMDQLGIFSSGKIATPPTVIDDEKVQPTVSPALIDGALQSAQVTLLGTKFDLMIKALINGQKVAGETSDAYYVNKVINEKYNGNKEELKKDIDKSAYSDDVKSKLTNIVNNIINNNGNNTNNNGNNQIPTTIITTTTTTTTTTDYYWESSLNSWVDVSQEKEFTKEKTLTINAEMSGWKDWDVLAESKDCLMYVDGKKVANNNGKGTFKVTKNGTYNVYVTYPTYGEGQTHTITINTIDHKKPSYEITKTYDSKTIQDGGAYGTCLHITAKDDCELKSIFINDTEINVEGYKTATRTYSVVRTGNYKIKIVDKAGNIYEKTEYVEVDNEAPEIIECTVVKKNNKEEVNVADSKYCIAKVGDTVEVTLKANENIKSYGEIGSPYRMITLNGYGYKTNAQGNSIKVNSDTITFDIELTEEIMDELKDEDDENFTGWVDITVYGITDNTNNHMDYTVKDLLYVDNTAPTIKEVNITNGIKDTKSNRVFLENDNDVVLDIYMNEKLSKDIKLRIGNITTTAKYYSARNKGDAEEYLYKAKLSGELLIKVMGSYLTNNKEIPINIINCTDLAGNIASDYIINKTQLSSNNKYLYYGCIELDNSLFIASTEKANGDSAQEDVNKDGFITSYDSLLMQRYLSKINESSDKIYNYSDINSDGHINTVDSMQISKAASDVENKIKVGEEKTFKVYDKNNNQLTGANLTWKVYDKDGNVITSEDPNILLIPNSESGTLSITAQSTSPSPIVVKALWNEETKETLTSEIKLYIEGSRTSGDSIRPVIQVATENKNNFYILGDVNNDGYITDYDMLLIQRHILLLDDNLSEEDLVKADTNKDGNISLKDASVIQRSNYNAYNIIKSGNSIDLEAVINISQNELKTFSKLKEENAENDITWEIIQNENSFEIKRNIDGTATLRAIGKDGDRAIVRMTTKIIENDEEKMATTLFYVEVAENIDIELSKDEIEFDLSKQQNCEVSINASINISNKKIEWRSNDENIAKVEVDVWGNAKIIPVNTGTTTIDVICDGVTKSCKVNIIKSIKNININKQSIAVKETLEEKINITVDSDATEHICLNSKDENIARIYFDDVTKTYKIKAINVGTTNIEVFSASNPEIKKVVNVTVEKLNTPKITDVTIENSDNNKYNVGDKISIKLKFDDVVIGEAPKLLLKFGNYRSENETEFVKYADNNTSLIYSYEVAEGDNGSITIEKLVEGGIKDNTSKLNANKTMSNSNYNRIYEDEKIATLNSTNNQENNVTSRANYIMQRTSVSEDTDVSKEDEYINDGIYKLLGDYEADTTKPTISLETKNQNNWVKMGDEISVTVLASEELQNAPKVYFNGIEATVEGSKEVFTAKLKVTEELKDGFVEVKVNTYKDLAGNSGDELIAKEENIDEPIIIDNSAPVIKSIKAILQEGKAYKAGDSFDILVEFADASRSGIEYVQTKELPKLNLKFGDNVAQGNLTSDYELGKYVQRIKYTYTLSEKDCGELLVDSIIGSITDAAGNTNNLSGNLNLNMGKVIAENGNITNNGEQQGNNNQQVNNEQQGNNNQQNNTLDIKQDSNNDANSNDSTDNKSEIIDKIYNGILPQTGIGIVRNICILVVIVIAIILAIYCYKKGKI